MWRVSSVLWGIGLLADAGLRVLFALTLRPDLVPALNLALYGLTLPVLNTVTHAYYTVCGVHHPRSPLRREPDHAPRVAWDAEGGIEIEMRP